MKKLLVGVATVALMSSPIALPNVSLGVSTAHAQQAEVSISVFFDGLRDHGSWVSHPRHRHVWVPTEIDAGWVPYSNGHWVYTEQYGWYFESDEPFAWAVYHYGRWAYDQDIGWFWVPGTRWAPAWVSWRRADDYIGWAPLPPAGDGFVVSIEVSTVEPPPGYWVFVPVNGFTAPDLSVTIVERSQVPAIYERTEVLGPVTVENNVIVNNVIDIEFIEQNTEEEVDVVEIRQIEDPSQAAQSDAPVAFIGEITAAEDAAPEDAVETADVESRTEGRNIESVDDGTGETDGDAPTEAPTEEPSADEPPTGEATDEAPAEDTPSDEQPADGDGQAPTDEPPTDQEPSDGMEDAPAEEDPANGAPTDDAPEAGEPSDQAPTEQEPAEEAPAEEQSTGEGEGAAPSEAPAEQPPAEDQPPAEVPAEEEPSGEAEEVPQDGAPADECPPEAENCPE